MSKLFKIITIFLSITGCSLDHKSGIWNGKEKPEVDKKNKDIFKKEKIKTVEFNRDIKIYLEKEKNQKVNLINTNNLQIIKNILKLNKISKYNFSKIKRFNGFDPKLIFHNEKIFFFDNKGALLKFSNNLKPIWKKNHYSKIEKKLNPILYISASNKTIVIADTISKLQAVDSDSGDIVWSTYTDAPFNTYPKIYKDKVFILDSQNQLNCYSILDGKKIWDINTEKSFINSSGQLSIAIKDNVVFFSNSLGDITAVDANTGILIWQISTQNSTLYEDIIKFKTSTLVATYNSIVFSNNNNEFYSLDQLSGKINWKQKINSVLKPVIIGNYIITISNDGYLFYIDHDSGNIVKIVNIFSQLNSKLKKGAYPIGFTMTYKYIYLTTNSGNLVTFDIRGDKIESVIKIDGNKTSRPFIFDKNIFIIRDNSVIKFN